MKITGYRTLTAASLAAGHRRRQRPHRRGRHRVPIVIVETDGGIEGVGIGSHADLECSPPSRRTPGASRHCSTACSRRCSSRPRRGDLWRGREPRRRSGTSRRRPRASRCGGCSAAATGSSPPTPPGSTRSTTRSLLRSTPSSPSAASSRASSRAGSTSMPTCVASPSSPTPWRPIRHGPGSCSTRTSRGRSSRPCGTSARSSSTST